MQVKVLFFGVLAEVAGTACKYFNNVDSVDELRLKIEDNFPQIANYNFRISLNSDIISDNRPLNDGDELALLPPFAGG